MELVTIVGYLCTASSICFQFVGMQVCIGVVRKGGTGDMSPFTFIAYFVACAVWLKYGLIRNYNVLIGVNLIGTTLNCIYIIIFYKYSIKKSQFHRFMLVGALMLITPLLYVKYYQTNMELATSHLGKFGVFLSIIGYGAPLISLRVVMKNRSTECLSFVLILANFLLAILWTIYGGLIEDQYVQAPNFLGGILALMQLSLFVIYPNRSLQRGKPAQML